MQDKQSKIEAFYSGTSGLVLPYKSKSLYPAEFQQQERLAYYGHLFNSIEINSSFYRLPMERTVGKWVELVPGDFRFTFKVWKLITHNKELAFELVDVHRFMQVIQSAQCRSGCLLIQLPPSAKFSAHRQLSYLLKLMRGFDELGGWQIAVEFRDPSWYRHEVYDLLNEFKVAMVIHDKKGVQSPMEEFEADGVYLRFHGPSGNYRESYDDAFLMEYSSYIREWISAGKTVYAYFNNTIGDAIGNLRTLNRYVREEY